MPKMMKNGLFNHRNTEALVTSKLLIDLVTPSVNSNPMIPHQLDKGLFLTSVSLVPKVLPDHLALAEVPRISLCRSRLRPILAE